MEILFEQQQITTLRQMCDNAKFRIWIASPFIGSLKDIQKIIGGKWMLPSVDCRVLTDVDAGFIRKDTFDAFTTNQVEIRHLLSLHAKIYIVDDWCLVTSANLTGTAFLCRYEMGVAEKEIADVEATFLKWWNMGKVITSLPKKQNKALVDYQDGKHFSRKFKAPAYNSGQKDKYDAACEKYNDFADLYLTVTGRSKRMEKDGFTLLQEIDYLFNFLYHDHPDTPSKGITTPCHLSKVQQEKRIKQYFSDMEKHYRDDPQKWRLDRTQTVQNILAPSNIGSITIKDATKVVMCLHCLASYPINRTKFLNPVNNSITDIRKCWNILLHTGPITSNKIKIVTSTLHNFGLSSVQELIGWYYPDTYPIMNHNSDCGMRFFGYNI